VRIGPAKVQILKSPGQRTVELITERSHWYRTNDDHARQ